MRAIVLGAAAGGGFPQWNSNGPGCRRARAGDPAAPPRTQAGLAVSGDGRAWTLLNASPDLRQQIERTPALHPQSGLRSTPIAAVVLTGGEVDAIAGLLTLRERQPFTLFATANVHAVLDANPVFEVLARDVVERRVVHDDACAALPGDIPKFASLQRVVGRHMDHPCLAAGDPEQEIQVRVLAERHRPLAGLQAARQQPGGDPGGGVVQRAEAPGAVAEAERDAVAEPVRGAGHGVADRVARGALHGVHV